MEVVSLEAIPVEVPVAPLEEEDGLAPYVSNHDEVWSVDRMLIRLETADGTVGWGEMLVTLKSPIATKAIIDDVVAPELVGRSVSDIQSFVESFYFPYVKIDPYVGAVEMAMWDAHGKQLGAPVSDLVGGATQDEVPVAYCVGILPPEDSAEHARKAHEKGFTALKTKAGPDWHDDVDRLTTMHDAVDGDLEFRLDPNQGWTFDEAVRAVAALEDEGVFLQYIEQPVRIESYGTYEQLRSRLRTPIGVNEDTYFRRNLYHLLAADAIDVGVVDIVPAGGILRTKGLAAMAAEAGVSLSHHCGFDLGVKTAAMLHTVASTNAIDLPPDTVYYGWDDYVVEDPLPVEDGAIPVPDGPGLGVRVDDGKIEEYRTDL